MNSVPDEILTYLGIPSAIVSVAATWYNLLRERQKTAFELTKNRLELLDQLETELAGNNLRRIEMAFLAVVGVSAHGGVIRCIWRTQASLGQMVYLARAGNRHLQVRGDTVTLRGRGYEWRLLGSGLWLVLIALGYGSAVDLFIAGQPKFLEAFGKSVLVGVVGGVLAGYAIDSIDKRCDAAALAAYTSGWGWVNRLIAWRRLPV